MSYCVVGELVVKTPAKIVGGAGDNELLVTCSDGCVYRFYNEEEHTGNDCAVWLEDLGGGDLQDLVGHEIVFADEASNKGDEDEDGTRTWTFITLRSHGGQVVMRWCG